MLLQRWTAAVLTLSLFVSYGIVHSQEREYGIISEAPDLEELEADLKIMVSIETEKLGAETAERLRPIHRKRLISTARDRKVNYNTSVRRWLPEHKGKRREELAKRREYTDKTFFAELEKGLKRKATLDYHETFRYDVRIRRLAALMRHRKLATADELEKVLIEEFGTNLKKQKQAFFERFVGLAAKD